MADEQDDPFAKYGGSEVKTTPTGDPFAKYGGSEVPKKAGAAGSAHTSPSLPNGLANFQNSLANTEPITPLTPQAHTDQAIQQAQAETDRQSRVDAANDKLRSNLAKLSPDERATIANVNEQGNTKPSDNLREPGADELAHTEFMENHPVVRALNYMGSQASHGAVQILKGAAHEWNRTMGTPGADIANDLVFDKADKAANLGLTSNDIANSEANKPTQAAGMMANFAPAIAGGATLDAPKAMMFLQGVGQGKEMADKMDLNPTAKEALIQGTGAVNLLLSDLGDGFLGKTSADLKGKVASGIAMDAIKESAEKGTPLTDALKIGVKDFSEKFKKAPIDALSHYNDAVKTFAKANLGNFAVHKAVDALNDKPVFNETPGDLAATMYKSVTQDAPMFAAIPAAMELTKLTPYSNYKNDVIEGLAKDPNSADAIKKQVQDHGQSQGWTPEQIDATQQHVDKIANAVKVLPKDMPIDKKTKAMDLVVNRNDLQSQLADVQGEKAQLDPALSELPNAHETLLTDKIDQANDKLRDLVNGTKTTYSKGTETDGEDGKFFKTINKEREEITPSRYQLENLERPLTIKSENNENSTEKGNEKETSSEKESPDAGEENGVATEKSHVINPETGDVSTEPVLKEQAQNEQTEVPETPKTQTEGSADPQAESKTTSTKNAKIDSDREKRGLSPIMGETARDFPKVWDEAMKRIEGDPNAGRDLVDELAKNPRATTDVENALIAHHLAETKNAYDNANEEVVKAQDAGEDTEAAEGRVDTLAERLHQIESVSRKSGTETGRGLNARKMMIRDDMSLANLETRKRVALGRALTPEERADVRKVHEDYEAKSAKYEKKIAELEQRNRDLQERQQMQELKSEARKEARGKRLQSRKSDRDQLISDIRSKLKIARTTERLNVSIPFAQQVAELAKISPELAKLAKSYIADGIDKLDDLVEKIREHLPEYDPRAIRDAISGYGRETERETKPELQAKLEELKKQARLLSKLEDLENKQYKAPERNKAAISKEISDLRKQVRELQQPDITLKSLKTRTANQIAEYKRRLNERDFSPPTKRNPTILDPEAIKAQGERDRVKADYEGELEKDRLANRGKFEKGFDTLLKYRRAELLLNLSGAAKVGMASAYRILSQPLHELAGEIPKLLLPRIAAKAAREGHGFVSNVEWKALKTVWNGETLSEVKKKLKGQLDNLDTAFGDGKQHYDVNRLLDLAGNIHSAEKEFAKQNEFRRSVLLRTKHAEANGVDTSNPLVQIKIGKEALEDANRQIFMGDNLANSGYKQLVSSLENAKEEKYGKAGKIAAGALKLLLPIVKVPTNYLLEKAQYTPILGATRALMIMSRGIDKMSPKDADYVMRIMKKQGVGWGAMAIGYANPQIFGGLHVPGAKRKDGDLDANDLKLFGVKIPHFLTHTPLLTIMQLGATIRRAGMGDVAMASAGDMAESTPFYETPKEAVKAMESAKSMQEFLGGFMGSLLVPNVVKQAAEHFDTDSDGNQIKRSPKTIGQGIEESIPGLRQNVPVKTPHPGFDKIKIGEDEYHLNNDQVLKRQKYYDDFMKTPGAIHLKVDIVKTDNKAEKEKMSKHLKEMASRFSKFKIMRENHDMQKGTYGFEKVEE